MSTKGDGNKKGFIMIPKIIVNNPKISNGAIRCWLHIKSKLPGYEFSSYRMTYEIKSHPNSIKKYINELIDLNILEKKQNTDGTIEYIAFEPGNTKNGNTKNVRTKNVRTKNVRTKNVLLSNTEDSNTEDSKTEFKEQKEINKEKVANALVGNPDDIISKSDKPKTKASLEKKTKKKKQEKFNQFNYKYDLPPNVNKDKWYEWLCFRKALGHPYQTKAGVTKSLNILRNHHDPIAVIDLSIANEWQGLFPDNVKPKKYSEMTPKEQRHHDDMKFLEGL